MPIAFRQVRAVTAIAMVLATFGCSPGRDGTTAVTDTTTTLVVPVVVGVDRPPTVAVAVGTQVAVVGAAFTYDCTNAGTTFTDPRARGLTYVVTFSPTPNGLTA